MQQEATQIKDTSHRGAIEVTYRMWTQDPDRAKRITAFLEAHNMRVREDLGDRVRYTLFHPAFDPIADQYRTPLYAWIDDGEDIQITGRMS